MVVKCENVNDEKVWERWAGGDSDVTEDNDRNKMDRI